jgi:L-ascorbate metabolism protein UlaG (beta-lactamase superfamily)
MRSLLILVMLAAAGTASFLAQAPPVTLTYLANMGVLLESRAHRVVIDGFHRGGLPEYAAVPRELLEPLEQARGPFATLDLALTTHRHLDHFDAGSVDSRLRADDRMVFVAGRETIDALPATSPPDSPRVRGVVPPGRGEQRVTAAGIEVTVLDLPHNPTPSRRVANVGFLIDLAGVRILHVGDAQPDARTFDVHHLSKRRVDAAIVPFWYLTGADDTVRTSIGARLWVASHVPPADAAAVRRQVRARIPRAIVLTTPGEQYTLR